MKPLLTMLLMLLALTARGADDAMNPIERGLVDEGFENVRALCSDHCVTVALEDHRYRGIYYGLAQALRNVKHALRDEATTTEGCDTIRLIALDDGMPRLTLTAVCHEGEWRLDAAPGGRLPKALTRRKAHQKSAWKLDVVPYPTLAVSDDYMDYVGDVGWERFWSLQLYVNPALEMTLWRGARLTLQERILLANNDKLKSPRRLTPGYMTLRQRLLSTWHVEMTATVGLYNLYRNGLDLRADWHLPLADLGAAGCWQTDLGVMAGWTGPWYMKARSNVPVICRWDKVHALAHVNLTETRTHTQLELKAGRFVLGDWGMRLDAQRHFHDRSIGVYLTMCEACTGIGFDFSLPIGPWKRGKHRRVNLRLPETYFFTFGDAVEGDRLANNRDVPCYRTGPQENYSAGYWQAETVRDFVISCEPCERE